MNTTTKIRTIKGIIKFSIEDEYIDLLLIYKAQNDHFLTIITQNTGKRN